MPSLHHTGLTVRDLDASLRFYRDLLGMEVLFEAEREGGYFGAIVGYPDARVRMAHVVFPGSEHRLEIFEYIRPEPRGDPGEPRDVGITHVCLAVEDMEALHARLAAAGVDFYSEPVLVDQGVSAGGWGVYLRDPDGITVELFQPPQHPGS
jgi:catechol 2,3-dioxygenase-like lactoylglutathione lyase family enzyme